MKKVLILDPSCVADDRTHNLQAILGHARTFVKAGYEVILATNAGCKLDEKRFVNCPAFTYTIYDDHRQGRKGVIKRWLSENYYNNLVNATTGITEKIIHKYNLDAADHIFVPTTDWILLQSLINIYSFDNSLPRLHLLIMYERGDWMTGGYPYKKIIKTLVSCGKLNNKIYIYTETTAHSENLFRESGFSPPAYPFPSFPFSSEIHRNSNGKDIYIGALGGGRKDKGFSMLPGIISEFNRKYCGDKNAVFLIQKPRSEDRLTRKVIWLERFDNVRLLDNHLPKKEYCRYLVKCDVCIFPYSPAYRTRGSGLVNEAVANHIPVICSGNTALAEAITHDNGKTAGTVGEFSSAIIDIINNLDTYKENAVKAADHYLTRIYNNPVIENIRNIS